MGLSLVKPEVTAPIHSKKPKQADKMNTLAPPELREAVLDKRPGVRLTLADCQILCALSAIQIRYGKSHEAVVYLMAVRQHYPGNPDATRLLATAFMKLGRWDEAHQMADEYQSITQNPGRMFHLYRAIIEFKQSRLANAREWLAKFVGSKEAANV